MVVSKIRCNGAVTGAKNNVVGHIYASLFLFYSYVVA